jgi:HK97 family phage prohead protease
MLIKSAPALLKAVDEENGTFEAIVSVFGNKDSYGDVIIPGAFAETLAEWAASGDPIPIYWSHQMSDPDFNIGHVLEAKEIDKGLWVKGQLDLVDALPGSKAPQVHRLMKGRRVKQFSFAYDIVEAGFVETEDDHWYELRKLKIHEVGPTPIGANQDTELLTVKAAAASASRLATSFKAGRAISAKNENTLRKALESIEDSAALRDEYGRRRQVERAGQGRGDLPVQVRGAHAPRRREGSRTAERPGRRCRRGRPEAARHRGALTT